MSYADFLDKQIVELDIATGEESESSKNEKEGKEIDEKFQNHDLLMTIADCYLEKTVLFHTNALANHLGVFEVSTPPPEIA